MYMYTYVLQDEKKKAYVKVRGGYTTGLDEGGIRKAGRLLESSLPEPSKFYLPKNVAEAYLRAQGSTPSLKNNLRFLGFRLLGVWVQGLGFRVYPPS